MAWVLLCIALVFWAPADTSAKSKPQRAPRPDPELKILNLDVSPNPYRITSGSLQFSAVVQLPKELNGATLLHHVAIENLAPLSDHAHGAGTARRLDQRRRPAASLCSPDMGRVGPEESPGGNWTLSVRSACQIAGKQREGSQNADSLLAETGNDRSEVTDSFQFTFFLLFGLTDC